MATHYRRPAAIVVMCLCAELAAGAQTITREDIRRAVAGLNLHPGIQTPAPDASWAAVRALKLGTKLLITTDLPPVSGELRSVGDGDVTIWRSGQMERISRERIREIAVPGGMSRGHHVALGFLIGGAVGVIAAAVSCKGQGDGCMEGSPGYFYPAAGLGALVGVTLPVAPPRIVYRRP